jgi:hypothetical protein
MRRSPLHRTDPHTLAGAHALDALSPADRSRFERHLGTCPSCRQETQGLHEATAMLAATSVTPPPDALRARVLAAASRTRQGSPVTGPAPRAARPRRRWGLAAACGAAAAVLAFGGLAYHDQQQLSQEQSRARAVAAVLGAPDAVMMTAQAVPGGSATVVMSHHERMLVFTAARLPALPSARRYELWLMGGGRARAAGMLPPPHAGVTAPVVVSGLRPGDTVALTVEPAAGASRPTSPMVVRLALPS